MKRDAAHYNIKHRSLPFYEFTEAVDLTVLEMLAGDRSCYKTWSIYQEVYDQF